MDCVNHTGVERKSLLPELRQGTVRDLCSKSTGRTGSVRALLCSLAGAAAALCRTGSGRAESRAAAFLGVIPGVGAMYNGQVIKGLIHVVIFAVLVNMADHFGIFGIFIAAWVLYQVFDAYHTAAARRDGLPLPDPLGLNEASNWFNFGQRPPAPPMPPPPGAPYGTAPGAAQAGYPPPQAGPYAAGFTPVAGYGDPAIPPMPPIPPLPPEPPVYWRRKEPIGAIILIGLGVILLLNQMGFVTEMLWGYMWPLLFIALGAWLIYRRVSDTKGGK